MKDIIISWDMTIEQSLGKRKKETLTSTALLCPSFQKEGFIAGHYFLCCNPKIGSGQYKNLDKDKTNGTTFLPPIILKAYASIHFILVKKKKKEGEKRENEKL